MTQERIKLRKVEFPQAKNIHGKTFQQLPGMNSGRNRLQDLDMAYLPELEMVEIDASNFPRILVPVGQVSYMEPEQEKAALPIPGPEIVTPEQLAELQKAPEPVDMSVDPRKVEGARDSSSPPLPPEPDLRPPPKEPRATTLVEMLPSSDKPDPKPDRFAKVGKKRGRPKKAKK